MESICEDNGAQTVVIRETGPVGWMSKKPPRKVEVNSADVTDQVRREGWLYTIELPEGSFRLVLTIVI